MKFAAIRYGDRRWVARVDAEASLVYPFDISEAESQSGITCLMERHSMPPTLSEVSLRDIELLAPVPVPARNIFCVGKNYYEHAEEFSRSGFELKRSSRRDPQVSDHLQQSAAVGRCDQY